MLSVEGLEAMMQLKRFGLVACLFLTLGCGGGTEGPPDPPQDTVADVTAEDTAGPPVDTAAPPEDTATPPEDTATPPEDTMTPPEDVQPTTNCATLCNGIMAQACENGPTDDAACLALCTEESAGNCANEWVAMEACVMAEMGMVQWVCGDDGNFAIAGDCSTEFGAWHACNQPPANPCDPNPCQNNGNCKVDAEGQVECYCVDPFSGEFCETCNPTCEAGVCGMDDGCGGICGCPEGASCMDDGSCCMPSCEGKSCGGDGCGGDCGTCDEGLMCNDKGECAQAENPKKSLCIETGGEWKPMSCGDWTCGIEPLCKAIKPGCNCGLGRSFDAETGCFKDDTCEGDACNPNPCPVGKNCKLKPDGDFICMVDVPDWCAAICLGMSEGCPAAMEGSVSDCEKGCADNFLDKCQPPHMEFANCFPGDGAWVCDPLSGIAPADGQCSKQWAAIAACENGENPPSICPDGLENLGEFATWFGKVNVYTDPSSGTWMSDADCKSGCNVNDVGYCTKYYPGATEVVEIDVSDVIKPFFNAGCKQEYPNPGKKQYACCGYAQLP